MTFLALAVFALIIFAGFVLLQIYFSKTDHKWVGLVLPIITFCFALPAVLAVTFDRYYGLPVLPYALAFFTPTAVLLAIYAAGRGKRTKRRALEKMSAQDLE